MEDPAFLMFCVGVASLVVAVILLTFGINDGDDHPKLEMQPGLPLPPGVDVALPEMSEADRETWDIFEDAFKRYKLGEARYGVFNKDTDQRDFLEEAEQELLDSIVYARFEIARLRAVRKRIRTMIEVPDASPWANPWGML